MGMSPVQSPASHLARGFVVAVLKLSVISYLNLDFVSEVGGTMKRMHE